MKKALLLRTARLIKKSKAYTDSDFFQQASEGLYDFYESSFNDLIIGVGDGDFSIFDAKNHLDLSEYSVIFIRGSEHFNEVRDAAYAITKYGELHDIEILNTTNEIIYSKLAHAVRFETLDIPVSKTFWLTPALIKHPKLAEGLHFPCIMKATFSSQGRYNYKCKNFKEVKKHFAAHPKRHFVLQNFFEGDGDYRLLFVDKKKLLISYQSDPTASYSQKATIGANATTYPITRLPKKAIHDTKRLIRDMDIRISGTDILVNHTTNEYTFLEINSFPGLTNIGDPVEAKLSIFRRLFKKNK